MSSQREVSITGNNNTRVKVTGQEELLVRVNSVDLTTTGLAKESTLQTVNTSLNNIESALTGTFTAGAILGSGLTFPYDLPAATYTGVTLIVPTGQTIDFEGATLPAGTYSFSGEGSQTCNGFTLSNPSLTPSGIILLTVE
jgi:hypothetical protein